jgi:hypothetical protein
MGEGEGFSQTKIIGQVFTVGNEVVKQHKLKRQKIKTVLKSLKFWLVRRILICLLDKYCFSLKWLLL